MTGSVGEPLTDCAQGCENSDEEMGLSRRRPVGRLRLRGATDDGTPPLLPSEVCTADDLARVTERQRHSPASGEKLCEGHERRKS